MVKTRRKWSRIDLVRCSLAFALHMNPVTSGVHQLLSRNVEQFRGVLTFKAHSFVYHSNLSSRVIKKKFPWAASHRHRASMSLAYEHFSEPLHVSAVGRTQGVPQRRRGTSERTPERTPAAGVSLLRENSRENSRCYERTRERTPAAPPLQEKHEGSLVRFKKHKQLLRERGRRAVFTQSRLLQGPSVPLHSHVRYEDFTQSRPLYGLYTVTSTIRRWGGCTPAA